MISIQKFDPVNFDRSHVWNERYAQMYALQEDFREYKKQEFWPLLEKWLKKDGRYLDAGCGIGGWIMFLSEQGFAVEGIDSHAQAVRAMTEYNPDISVKIAHTSAIPYMDNSFDGILSIGSLEYAQNEIEESLGEFYRVLKNDGFLLLEVPLYNSLRKAFYVPMKKVEGFVMSLFGRKPTFAYYLFDRNELKNMLVHAGFAVNSVSPHDLPDKNSHFGLYANWPLLRGKKPYELNAFGIAVKNICNAISPWFASAGMVLVATKQSSHRPQ